MPIPNTMLIAKPPVDASSFSLMTLPIGVGGGLVLGSGVVTGTGVGSGVAIGVGLGVEPCAFAVGILISPMNIEKQSKTIRESVKTLFTLSSFNRDT